MPKPENPKSTKSPFLLRRANPVARCYPADRHKSPRGSELVFLATPNSDEEIELCSYPSSGGVQVQEDLTHLAFEVESLVEFEKHIQSLGVEYSDGPHMKDSGGGFAFIDAPEGYEIELIEKVPDSSGY